MIKTDPPLVNIQRRETSEDPGLNGTSGYHTFLPRINDHDDREARETVRARGSGQLQQDSVFCHKRTVTHVNAEQLWQHGHHLYKINTDKYCMEEERRP